MIDRYGRTIDYLRISVTDRCNLRCRYCMPEGIESVPMRQILTFEEIRDVVQAAAANGIRHIKLTGGEPLVRKGLPDLVRILKAVDGIEKVTLTTNGVLLGLYLPELIGAGLDAVNISLDTTDRQKYKELTGSDELNTVMSAIHIANELDIRVKVNAVSLDLGEANIRNLIEIARQDPIDVRFIEMMPIGFGKNFETVNHRDLFKKLETMYSGIMIDEREHGFGPAVYYKIPGYLGSKRDSRVWLITEVSVKNQRNATIEVINDYGSEDFIAHLSFDDEGNLVMKHEKGSTYKIVVNRKYVKIPSKIVLKRE